MSKLLKWSYLLLMLAIVMAVSGCGGDARNESSHSAIASIDAAINPDGTATTGAHITIVATAHGAPECLANVSAMLPPGTTITAKNADGSTGALTAKPSFTFMAPADSSAAFSGTMGVPVPTGFTSLASVSGAVDVQLTGYASATFNPPITITMPVPGEAVGSVIAVYSVTGTTYTLLGRYTVTTAGFVSFPVSSLSWKVGNPVMDTSAPTTAATTVPGTTVATTVPGNTVPGTTVPATTIGTTIPGTTIPVTTVATTVPGTTVPGTTIPGTTVATTVPATTVATTVPATTVATTVPPTTTVATTTVATTVATTVSTTVPTTVPPAIDGAALYAGTCQGCHGPLATPTRRIAGKTVAGIKAAGMAHGLTDAQLSAIVAVLP